MIAKASLRRAPQDSLRRASHYSLVETSAAKPTKPQDRAVAIDDLLLNVTKHLLRPCRILIPNDDLAAMLESHYVDYELEELFDGEDSLEFYDTSLAGILMAKYEAMVIQECVETQKHLTESQRLLLE
ncbi:hypothetical protein THAOC_12496 [Thalassiosira oceanica]|uniref:Uncharacterized protein n=1 Tax=Thalassiosira oceanica TaxID=159749 RepID=K0T7Y8_THAOC|nr:hypothetical protein THAOC_12496 [Thalassiosira oceanica]|eukprot:EJK66577.1 hypothetical protein THAOC_12496 [Thalassiosira oceanica]